MTEYPFLIEDRCSECNLSSYFGFPTKKCPVCDDKAYFDLITTDTEWYITWK